MDKKFEKILNDIEFASRYLGLWNKNKLQEGTARLLKEEVDDLFEELDFSVIFNRKEKFFKHIENEEETDFQLNIIISDVTVAFVLDVSSEKHKLSVGGPFGGFANDLVKELKVYPKIKFTDFDSLKEVLQNGIDLFYEIKDEYLKVIKSYKSESE